MTPERIALVFTTLFIAVTAVASGPLVPATDLTPAGEYSVTGAGFFDEGEVDVEPRLSFTPEPLPATGTLAADGDSYRVAVPETGLRIATGDAPATVRYAVRVRGLAYARAASVEVEPGARRVVPLALPADTVSGEAVTEGSYEATLVVVVTHDGQTFEAARGNATLEVVA